MKNTCKKTDIVGSPDNGQRGGDMIPQSVIESMDSAGDAFCLKLYEMYLADQDNGETVSFEEEAQQLGVHF